MRYSKRISDKAIKRALNVSGVVVVEGPKACGKTSSARQFAKSVVMLEPQSEETTVGLNDPHSILKGKPPRLIDEWQLVPNVWDAARREVDEREEDGQFILTGSAKPADDETRHSGAMRFARVMMRPMSLFEFGVSDGSVSLDSLWNGCRIEANDYEKVEKNRIIKEICRGGWPSNLRRNIEESMLANKNYIRTVVSTDIITVDGVKRDPLKVNALLYAIARNSASYASNKTLKLDSSRFEEPLNDRTLVSYLDALSRLFIYVEQPAWGQHLRSTTAVRSAPKRHLVDPSLAVAALRASPKSLSSDSETLGFLFESLVFRDICVYADFLDLRVVAHHDSNDNEIDIVLTDGIEWAGIEVKLGSSAQSVKVASDNLIRISRLLKTEPKFLAVITPDSIPRTQENGVHVFSIGNLGV
ncbi:MAG: DUF4143 domain-containing protein [Candidatus Ancillula sp.]|jgi:predicted AAA+ superfamily ATPase|nr:DUF4143 domain-containing protein [Candidatus Ancillula sp.]